MGSQIFHASGQLVGARHQVLEGHLLLRNTVNVIGVLHPRRPPGPEVFTEVAFRGILNYDVQRPWGRGDELSKAANPDPPSGSSVRSFSFIIQYFFRQTYRKAHTTTEPLHSNLPKFIIDTWSRWPQKSLRNKTDPGRALSLPSHLSPEPSWKAIATINLLLPVHFSHLTYTYVSINHVLFLTR